MWTLVASALVVVLVLALAVRRLRRQNEALREEIRLLRRWRPFANS